LADEVFPEYLRGGPAPPNRTRGSGARVLDSSGLSMPGDRHGGGTATDQRSSSPWWRSADCSTPCCMSGSLHVRLAPAPSNVAVKPAGAWSFPRKRLIATSHTTAALSRTRLEASSSWLVCRRHRTSASATTRPSPGAPCCRAAHDRWRARSKPRRARARSLMALLAIASATQP